MERLTLSEIKNIELDILKTFDRFCRENNLYYSLCGGTLLGAVRHKGFIPWDDDIDVCMSRSDYEKFKKIFPEILNKIYKIRSIENNNFDKPYLKMININTKVKPNIEKEDINDSLWIDIFPVDGLPEDYSKLKKIYNKARIYRMLLMINCLKKYKPKGFFKNFIKPIVIFIAKLFGKLYWSKKLEKLALINNYDKSNFVGILVWGLYGTGERMIKKGFEKKIELEFEKNKFYVFSCWDDYLKGIYGEYMKIPPIENRKIHDIEAYFIKEDK